MYNSIYKRISKSYFLLMVVCWLLSGYGATYAQENAANGTSGFSGVVVDQYGRPVQGVEIAVKASNYKAISDETGTFGIDAINGNILILTHPDYLIKEVKVPKNIKKGTVFTVDIKNKKLKNPLKLDVPYGRTIDKESYLGAASTIYTDEITPTLSANILGALAGRLPGLYVSQSRGYRNTYTGASTLSNAYLGGMADDSRVGYNDNTQYSFS